MVLDFQVMHMSCVDVRLDRKWLFGLDVLLSELPS